MDNGKRLIFALSDKRIYNIPLFELRIGTYDIIELDDKNDELGFRETGMKIGLKKRKLLGGNWYRVNGRLENGNGRLDGRLVAFTRALEEAPSETEVVLFYSTKSFNIKEREGIVEVHYYGTEQN